MSAMSTVATKKRRKYANSFKIKMISEMKASREDGIPRLSKQYQVPEDTLRFWKYHPAAIMEAKSRGGKVLEQSRNRSGRYPVLDKMLFNWFVEERCKDKPLPVSIEMIVEKASQFVTKANIQLRKDKPVTAHYVRLWAKRFNVKLASYHGEALSSPTSSIQSWFSDAVPSILGEYKEENIFNCDELGLLYRSFYPKRTLCLPTEKPSSIKQSKERITVLLCASALGEKRNLVVIGRSRKPRKFDTIISRLPIVYCY
jgi:hypothetical protein